MDNEAGMQITAGHAEELLGPVGHDPARIMGTMPTEAAHRYSLVRDLVAAGMDVLRIDCAHDDEIHWAQMVKHLDRARRETARECRETSHRPDRRWRARGALEAEARCTRLHGRAGAAVRKGAIAFGVTASAFCFGARGGR